VAVVVGGPVSEARHRSLSLAGQAHIQKADLAAVNRVQAIRKRVIPIALVADPALNSILFSYIQ
jgi:hypothetical protein